MSNEALTRAQKAQITRQRKRLEELAYAADLEKQGKGLYPFRCDLLPLLGLTGFFHFRYSSNHGESHG